MLHNSNWRWTYNADRPYALSSTRSMSAKVPFPLLLASLAVSFSRPSRDWSTKLLIRSTPTLSCTSSSTLLCQSMYVVALSFVLFLKRGRVAPLALCSLCFFFSCQSRCCYCFLHWQLRSATIIRWDVSVLYATTSSDSSSLS